MASSSWCTERCFPKQRLSKQSLLVRLARERARRFGIMSLAVVGGTIIWLTVRYFLMIEGEDSVTKDAFDKLSVSIKNTIKKEMEQDLVYQDLVANLWIMNPNISRADFRSYVMSESYRPGLEIISGMSLIPRVLGAEVRRQLESGPEEEELRQRCCNNATGTGSSCATVAATGLFCREQAYGFTQFAAGGVLVPANGSSQAYLDRVGQEEYMIVHMIEPFETNSKVWGFNLLSSDARLQAWRSAMSSGMKTFTRRLSLVQGSGNEYGVLVWLPLFADSAGKWTTAFHGNLTGLTPVASVNGVYFLQELVTKSVSATYSAEQLSDVSIFLYDNAVELNGNAQFLAAYGVEDAFNRYGNAPMADSYKDAVHYLNIPLDLETTDLRWTVIVCMAQKYSRRRRTWMPEIATCIGILITIVSFTDRALGHPILLLMSLKRTSSNDKEGTGRYSWMGRRLSLDSLFSSASAGSTEAGGVQTNKDAVEPAGSEVRDTDSGSAAPAKVAEPPAVQVAVEAGPEPTAATAASEEYGKDDCDYSV